MLFFPADSSHVLQCTNFAVIKFVQKTSACQLSQADLLNAYRGVGKNKWNIPPDVYGPGKGTKKVEVEKLVSKLICMVRFFFMRVHTNFHHCSNTVWYFVAGRLNIEYKNGTLRVIPQSNRFLWC